MVVGPIEIDLIRHGEVHNPQQILYGRLPRFRLNANGRHQAKLAGHCLNGDPLDALFSSPMLRARQTALEILTHFGHLTLRISTLINEVYTCYEGRPGAEIDAREGDVYTGAEACFEQPKDIVDRTRRFVARMRRQYAGGRVAAVTHGDVITFMVLWAKGYDLAPRNKTRLLQAGYPEAYPAHASITTLTYNTTDLEEKPIIAYTKP
ncbi:MAG: histidine phosphatase family protein [Desulfobacteraceae bacterium]